MFEKKPFIYIFYYIAS